MNCPYCNKEMLAGYFATDSQSLQWIPSDTNPPSLKWGVAKNAIQLTDVPFMLAKRKEAFACKECHKILIEYNENEFK